ncbi:pyruvate dehydrogenase (acetyl-transferring) E1 component subunit alpha [Streptomyces sp. TR1341]|nr:pyruvate dehydrogenase (acetyl-transferring) E1 component subunit alpha [Streptomyces sp. TR1341]
MLDLYRWMVVGRRYDREATALTADATLPIYPAAHGLEAAQVGAVRAIRDTDWVFPTFRENVALLARGVDPVDIVRLPRGEWHGGYDPYAHHAAPICTPLATHLLHAVGFAQAARAAGDDLVTLAFVGDGATSEGDFHEAVNLAAVSSAPTVFVVVNNQYAITTPVAKQTRAPSLAHKAIGYGIPGRLVDGNDVLAVHHVVGEAAEAARAGRGPSLIEAVTYRMDGHTNKDDDSRYRSADEVESWRRRDPIERLERYLLDRGVLGLREKEDIDREAAGLAAAFRARMSAEPVTDPADLFAHVYARPTPHLLEQARQVEERVARRAVAGGTPIRTEGTR